jgi:hypothetical protein
MNHGMTLPALKGGICTRRQNQKNRTSEAVPKPIGVLEQLQVRKEVF